GRVGFIYCVLQRCVGNLAFDEGLQERESGVGIGRTPERVQIGSGKAWPLTRNVEASVAGKSAEQHVGEAEFGSLAARAQIGHLHKIAPQALEDLQQKAPATSRNLRSWLI